MSDLKHFGILGMRWGVRRNRQATSGARQAILDKANKVLNNPKSSQKDLDSALASIGVDPKTGKTMKTKPVYDKKGNDISVNPVRRLGKAKGQSDKDFDREFDKELKPPTKNDLAKQKVEDIKLAKETRQRVLGVLAVVAAIQVAKYVALNQIQKSYEKTLIEKYGATIAEMMLQGSR